MSSYPISLALEGKAVLVVGGGAVAERKVRGLVEAGAKVRVVALEASPELRAASAAGHIELVERAFEASDVLGSTLAFAATSDAAVNARVVAAARACGILVNDTSAAEQSDFANVTVHRAGPLTFAVDTAGTSPSFALRLRDELAQHFDQRYARAGAILAKMRAYTLAVVPAAMRSRVMSELASREISALAAIHPAMAENEVDDVVERLAASIAAGQPNAAGSEGTISHAVVATRASALAMWQTKYVMAQLAQFGTASTVLEISTKGDRIVDRPLAALGTDSIFVKELELALREHRADYAVHSCKDLPSELPSDMRLAAISAREDARDVFCSERYESFDALPAGAVVGTSSPRRVAQLRALRPDLRFEPIRGNVDTRLRKLREGDFDAIVLANAGLRRLQLAATHTVPFTVEQIVPAVGQGALAVECRIDDERLAIHIGDALADRRTTLAVLAERAFLHTFRAGCQAPIGAHARFDDDESQLLHFEGVVATLDGSRIIRANDRATIEDNDAAEAFGRRVATQLIERGGNAILASISAALGPLAGTLIVLPRTQDRPSRIAPALRDAGAEVIEAADSDALEAALGSREPGVLLVPSSGSVEAIRATLGRWSRRGVKPIVAAMGEQSTQAASAAGFPPDVVADEATTGAFVQAVMRYLLARSGDGVGDLAAPAN